VLTRSGAIWSQQGSKLFPSDAIFVPGVGCSVSINSDGSYVVLEENGITIIKGQCGCLHEME
jgi:hypothetical protein